MPSTRRLRLVAVAAVTLLLLVLYYHGGNEGGARRGSYMDTLKAERARHAEREAAGRAAVAGRLKEAEDAAKKAAGIKGGLKPDSPKQVEKVMKGRVAGGGRRGEGEKEGLGLGVQGPEPEPIPTYDPIEDLASILKRSPIVIFSKTHCRHSKETKDLLLHKYMIVPAPFVVELDVHPHGVELQESLSRQTTRKTVPNILITGKSIGGNDELQQLERDGVLGDTIRKMGGRRIMRMLKLKD